MISKSRKKLEINKNLKQKKGVIQTAAAATTTATTKQRNQYMANYHLIDQSNDNNGRHGSKKITMTTNNV